MGRAEAGRIERREVGATGVRRGGRGRGAHTAAGSPEWGGAYSHWKALEDPEVSAVLVLDEPAQRPLLLCLQVLRTHMWVLAAVGHVAFSLLFGWLRCPLFCAMLVFVTCLCFLPCSESEREQEDEEEVASSFCAREDRVEREEAEREKRDSERELWVRSQ